MVEGNVYGRQWPGRGQAGFGWRCGARRRAALGAGPCQVNNVEAIGGLAGTCAVMAAAAEGAGHLVARVTVWAVEVIFVATILVVGCQVAAR